MKYYSQQDFFNKVYYLNTLDSIVRNFLSPFIISDTIFSVNFNANSTKIYKLYNISTQPLSADILLKITASRSSAPIKVVN